MSMLQFYTERSADCRREADATMLGNVRERYLSAALAWENMADRVRQTEAYRTDGVARKAAQQSSVDARLCMSEDKTVD